MKFFIPSIGDQFITTAPWELDLIHAYNSGLTEFLEEQNPGTFKRESTYDYNFIYEKNASGGWDYDKPKFTTVVLPAGVTLQLNKLDMKISTRSDKHRSSAGDSVTFKITAGLDTKKKLELFVKLTDANKLMVAFGTVAHGIREDFNRAVCGANPKVNDPLFWCLAFFAVHLRQYFSDVVAFV